MERRKGISSKRIASTKALRQERTWYVQAPDRRLGGGLEDNKQGADEAMEA